MPSPNIDPTVRLFIGGLPYRFTEGELLTLFAPFGRITFLKIMHTQWGKSRGIGFIEFDNLDSAISAKTKMHNYKIDIDRTIIVDYAEPDPFNTPVGQAKHADAVARKEVRFARFHKNTFSQIPLSPKGETPTQSERGIFKRKPVFGQTRQSVYDGRTHHSKVGAKFAKRNRGK